MTAITARALDWFEPRQLLRFATVGVSGYLVNIAAFAALAYGARLDFRAAATAAFLLAAANNYLWHRLWTFRDRGRDVTAQGVRFLVVSLLAYCANLALLTGLIVAGVAAVLGQALAIALVMPLSFTGNKAWTFRLTHMSDLHASTVKVRRFGRLLSAHEATARSGR